MELDWVETSMSHDVLVQASMLPDAVRNAREEEVDPHCLAVNVLCVVFPEAFCFCKCPSVSE